MSSRPFYQGFSAVNRLSRLGLYTGLLLGSLSATPQALAALEAEYVPQVQALIDAAKAGDRQAIAEQISYPLQREYPLPDVQNPQQLLTRFQQVFDSKLLSQIANSTTENNWETMGWRGIMLDHGSVWLDFDGKISGINYQSPEEAKLRDELIAQQKAMLHESVREFASPELAWETERFIIRVDALDRQQYRYAAWSKGKSLSEKPDLVLKKGKLVLDGNGGNHSFQFKSGPYLYVCDVIVLSAEERPIGELLVYKNDQLLVQEPVIKAL
ncbi:hypothetical protein [Shewanella seohaensis]|uniref:Periplasmic protein n=1 Tax=Shewanella seohaensis TaxID=755175 RepID=A0ABV4VU71_9GAMM